MRPAPGRVSAVPSREGSVTSQSLDPQSAGSSRQGSVASEPVGQSSAGHSRQTSVASEQSNTKRSGEMTVERGQTILNLLRTLKPPPAQVSLSRCAYTA